MTNFQLIALAILLAVAFANYALPHMRLPQKKADPLRHISQVLSIRESYESPKVKAACQELLQALLP